MDGRDVYRLRKLNSLSQAKLGERIGCSQSVVSRMENGKRKLRRDDVLMLSKAFPSMVILKKDPKAKQHKEDHLWMEKD